jgi:hypothetical protein
VWWCFQRSRYDSHSPFGGVAQLVERNNRTVEARGSIPLTSTRREQVRGLAGYGGASFVPGAGRVDSRRRNKRVLPVLNRPDSNLSKVPLLDRGDIPVVYATHWWMPYRIIPSPGGVGWEERMGPPGGGAVIVSGPVVVAQSRPGCHHPCRQAFKFATPQRHIDSLTFQDLIEGGC